MYAPPTTPHRSAARLLACLALAGLPAAAQTLEDAVLPDAGTPNGDRFGNAVAIGGATGAQVAVVGAPFQDVPFLNVGAAYIYANDGSGWTGPTRVDAGSGFFSNDNFGFAVATDGQWAVAGAPNSYASGVASAGAVFVFRNDPMLGWQLEHTLTASDAASGDDFGAAVAINAGRILVGAPLESGTGSAYLFSFDGSAWNQDAKITGAGLSVGASFGTSVALNGPTAVIGAPLQSGGGVARVHDDNAGAWTLTATLNPADDAADDQFGFSVGFDGDHAVVSAHLQDLGGPASDNRGAAYVYDAATWTQQAKLTADTDSQVGDNFAHSVSIEGGAIIVGTPRQGSATLTGVAYVFQNAGAGWARADTITASDAAVSGFFGWAVAGGQTALVGAPGNPQQSAYVYEIPPAGPVDSDGDGINDDDEINIYNTDPNNADSDGDGIDDGEEINTYGTDPNAADSDGDGLADGEEINTYGTSPLAADTDGDLLEDGEEIDIAEFGGCPDPLLFDTDADGIGDGEEHLSGLDPCDADSDGDGLADGSELDFGTDPLAQDSDGDGLQDGAEVDMAAGSGCPDPTNPDSDGDGLTDGEEAALGTSSCSTDTDGDGVGDAEDDEPTTPGVSSGYLEDSLRDLAQYVGGLPLDAFAGPNNHAARARRAAIQVHLHILARHIACERYELVHRSITRWLLPRVDGEPRPRDWMVDGPEREDVYDELLLISSLIEASEGN